MLTTTIRNKNHHPCFNREAKHTYARVHLPVAPKCNIQCKFCDRKYSCVNESRPGVTSNVLTPGQSMAYLSMLHERINNISVVGIAGPGDAFANHQETLETMRLVREKYPHMLFCIATNGLNILPYIDELARYDVTHVTITINAIDPVIGEKIYAWARDGIKVYRGREAAQLLIERQLAAVEAVHAQGIMVKVNTVIIPGVNDTHAIEIAKEVAGRGADIYNAMPLVPVADTEFADIVAMRSEEVHALREACGAYLPQMTHCSRCRADAAGCIGEANSKETVSCLMSASKLPANPEEKRPYVAVASSDGITINMHLGEATHLRIYEEQEDEFSLIEMRKTPLPGGGDSRWKDLSEALHDCKTLLVSSVGEKPRDILTKSGISVNPINGLIEHALTAAYDGDSAYMKKHDCGLCAKGGSCPSA